LSDGSEQSQLPLQRRTKIVEPHPPRFKVFISQVNKFCGNKGADDFEFWLDDFVEAIGDCSWDNKQRARWSSWLPSGPAKVSWQCTLKPADELQWDKIVEVFQGEYGIHLDPRTAYQCCHELRYEQFGSAQGLLTAMHEYQHMAPSKLTDICLESILFRVQNNSRTKDIFWTKPRFVRTYLHLYGKTV